MKLTQKLIVVFISILTFGCNNQKSKTSEDGIITVVTPSQFQEKSKGQTIIDIRTPKEFAQGHIKDAKNINYFDKFFLEEISKLDKNKPIFIYCRSGNRTSSASNKIQKLGYTQLYDLQGGISNWYKNKLKIVK